MASLFRFSAVIHLIFTRFLHYHIMLSPYIITSRYRLFYVTTLRSLRYVSRSQDRQAKAGRCSNASDMLCAVV